MRRTTRRTIPLRLLATAAVALAASGCESTAVGPGGPIILISNSWQNLADPDHTITFRSPDDGKDAGVISGTEEHPQTGISPVGGFWADGRIEFTVIRGDDRPKYVGDFTTENPDRLDFHRVNGAGTLTLVR